jgi:hypothetical protein
LAGFEPMAKAKESISTHRHVYCLQRHRNRFKDQ